MRETLEAFNADEALDDPDELEPDEPEPRFLNPDSPD